MYVRDIIEYTNKEGEVRLMLSMQDNKQDAIDLMLATKSQSEKIGTISLKRSMTMESSTLNFPLGFDLTAKYQFGEAVKDQDPKYQGKLYEIIPA